LVLLPQTYFVPLGRYETRGLVLNKALTNGLPRVVFDMTGCRTSDLIEKDETGFILGPEDVDLLVQCLLDVMRLISDKNVIENRPNKSAQYSIFNAAKGIALTRRGVIDKHDS